MTTEPMLITATHHVTRRGDAYDVVSNTGGNDPVTVPSFLDALVAAETAGIGYTVSVATIVEHRMMILYFSLREQWHSDLLRFRLRLEALRGRQDTDGIHLLRADVIAWIACYRRADVYAYAHVFKTIEKRVDAIRIELSQLVSE